MTEKVAIKVEIEIDIKHEVDDVCVKQEPVEETAEDGRSLPAPASCKQWQRPGLHHDAVPVQPLGDRSIKREPGIEAAGCHCEEDSNLHKTFEYTNDISKEKEATKGILHIKEADGQINKIRSVRAKIPEQERKKKSIKVSGPYFCEFCQKEFQHVCKLKRHMPVHTGQRPYVCDICGKRFGESSYLKLHMLMHKGEKAFPCQLCNKKFTHGSNLKRHQLTHTGERPFVCQVCHKAYADRSTLKQHRRIHDGEKPYVCEVCYQGFPQNSQLKKHMMKHEGAQPLFSGF